MARTPVRAEIEDEVIRATGAVDEGDLPVDDAEDTPSYELIGSASIPVSRKAGARWNTRINGALNAFDPVRQEWAAAYTTYRTCSLIDGLKYDGTEATGAYFEKNTDENVTRENVKTILRNTYTRNPTIELSTADPEDENEVECLKQVVNALLGRVQAPGLNAKSRIRRWIVHGHLTNFGVMRLDFQKKSGSRAEGQARLLDLQEKMSKEKDLDKLEELYAELEQVEESLPTMRDPGMILTNKPSSVIVLDPDTTYQDLSDCKWLDEIVWLGNTYLKNKFMKKDEDGTWVRKSDNRKPGSGFTGQPNNQNEKDIRDTIADQILGTTLESVESERNKDKTRCHIIWDRLTRQISLWIDGDWDYPLWVYQDDLKLSRFYQHFILTFAEPLDSVVQEGESAQYYGQAKEINIINERISYIRRLAYGSFIYNSKKVTPENVKKLVDYVRNPVKFEAIGIDFDPEVKLKDLFELFVPPDFDFQQLYDKSDLMRTIDRISSTSAVAKGDQFKTNTTNKAVEFYAGQAASVTNELTDAIEDALNDLVHAMLEIIVSLYTKEQVIALVGGIVGEAFQNYSVEEFNAKFQISIASGSTEKPSTDNKKREAMSLAQAIGQVGQAAPGTTLKIMFRMFKEAFSSLFLFGKQDQQLLDQEVQAQLTKGVSTAGQPNAEAPPAKAKGAP